jgi:hypothetical protein
MRPQRSATRRRSPPAEAWEAERAKQTQSEGNANAMRTHSEGNAPTPTPNPNISGEGSSAREGRRPRSLAGRPSGSGRLAERASAEPARHRACRRPHGSRCRPRPRRHPNSSINRSPGQQPIQLELLSQSHRPSPRRAHRRSQDRHPPVSHEASQWTRSETR